MEQETIEMQEVEMTEQLQHKAPTVQQQRAVTTTATPGDLLRYAMESGADLDRLEKLMQMQLAWEANEARKAYVAAMVEFKKKPPEIFKDKHVSFDTQKGTTEYDHATLGNVVEKVIRALADHGFSHRWVPGRTETGAMKVTCVITHQMGHFEETTLEGPADQSGGKNAIQAVSSTNTYLQRYSILLGCGLATKETNPDDDGKGSGTGKKEAEKFTINGVRFGNALITIKSGEYTAENLRKNYALTVDQETALCDLEKELSK